MSLIMHITECYEGGVSRAIDSRVRATPEHEHHLLWSGLDTPPDEIFAFTTQLPRGFQRRVRFVAKQIREVKPDILHAHSSWAGVYSRLYDRGIPVLYEPHCFKFDDPTISGTTRFILRFAEQILARNSKLIGVLSPHEEGLALSLGSKIETIFLPNTSALNSPDIPRATSSGVNPDVIMMGRIVSQKDPLFYIRVVDHIRVKFPSLRAFWIGDGDRNLRRSLNEAGIHVTGWLSEQEVASLLARGPVYIHSAEYEGFPLSVLDAAAVGCPIVVREIPAFEGTNLIQAKSSAALGELALNLLLHNQQRARAIQISSQLIRSRTESSLASALRDAYERLSPT